METITIEVQTQAHAEMILAKIMELQTQEIRITTNYSPKKAKTKAVKPKVKQVNTTKAEKATIKGLKELKQVLNGTKKSIDAKEALKNL